MKRSTFSGLAGILLTSAVAQAVPPVPSAPYALQVNLRDPSVCIAQDFGSFYAGQDSSKVRCERVALARGVARVDLSLPSQARVTSVGVYDVTASGQFVPRPAARAGTSTPSEDLTRAFQGRSALRLDLPRGRHPFRVQYADGTGGLQSRMVVFDAVPSVGPASVSPTGIGTLLQGGTAPAQGVPTFGNTQPQRSRVAPSQSDPCLVYPVKFCGLLVLDGHRSDPSAQLGEPFPITLDYSSDGTEAFTRVTSDVGSYPVRHCVQPADGWSLSRVRVFNTQDLRDLERRAARTGYRLGAQHARPLHATTLVPRTAGGTQTYPFDLHPEAAGKYYSVYNDVKNDAGVCADRTVILNVRALPPR